MHGRTVGQRHADESAGIVTIATWNAYNRADDTARLRRFVAETGPDVVAFQELTEAHVQALSALDGYQLHTAEDFREAGQVSYLGVLSRRPVVSIGRHRHNRGREVSPSPMGRRMRWIECVDSMCATVRLGRADWRIINLHLTCAASPALRRRQLEEALDAFAIAHADAPAVVMGDFNCFARPWLNWAVARSFAFAAGDLLVHEARDVEYRMRARGFHSLDHRATFPKAHLMLDRIFVRGGELRSLRALSSTYGSDHRPLVATLRPSA